MNVEQCYRTRRASDIEVQIQYRNRRFHSARGRHLSDQGMYLEISNLTLPTGTQVVLEVRDMDHEWRIPATVVHQDDTGIGVMFRDAHPEFLQANTESLSSPMPLTTFGTNTGPGLSAA
jgi:hypothetical protein